MQKHTRRPTKNLLRIKALIGSLLGLAVLAAPAATAELPTKLSAPEGITAGMSPAEAVSTLEASGFKRTTRCTFEKKNPPLGAPHLAGKTQVTLTMSPSPALEKTSYRFDRQAAADRAMAQMNCAYGEDYKVAAIDWQEWTDRSVPSLRPDIKAEMAALVAAHGPYQSCQIETPTEFRWCRWAGNFGAPNVQDLMVSLSANGTRGVRIAANPARIWLTDAPGGGSRASDLAQARELCETIEQGQRVADRMRALRDCTCLAEHVVDGYAAGYYPAIDRAALNKALLDHPRSCPQKPAIVKAWYQTWCEQTHGSNDGKAWSDAGGCACVAEQTTQRYLADPILDMTIGGSDLLACDFENRVDIAKKAKSEAMAKLPPVPAGLRPFEFLEHEGRLTVLNPVRGADNAQPFQRYMNLLILKMHPGLMENARAQQILAAENLGEAERGKLMKDCYAGSLRYCTWAGSNAAEQDANRQAFLSGSAASVSKLAAGLPDTLIIVETIGLGARDPETGRAKIRNTPGLINGDASLFNLAYFEISQKMGLAKRTHDIPYPSEWEMSGSEADAVYSNVKVVGPPGYESGNVHLAWTYRIADIAEPDNGEFAQEISVEPISAKIYADEDLKIKLVEFTPSSDGIIRAD